MIILIVFLLIVIGFFYQFASEKIINSLGNGTFEMLLTLLFAMLHFFVMGIGVITTIDLFTGK